MQLFICLIISIFFIVLYYLFIPSHVFVLLIVLSKVTNSQLVFTLKFLTVKFSQFMQIFKLNNLNLFLKALN